jgi:Tol biopolymer transport system component
MSDHCRRLPTAILLAALLTPSATAMADSRSGGDGTWSLAVAVVEVNSTAADGCPIESPDGRSLYFASTRPGGLGGNDIWVAHRRRQRDTWGTPELLAEPVNSTANDFCPTPLPGRRLLFVSERLGDGTCNAGPSSGDVYATRLPRLRLPSQPRHLGCVADGSGPNFDGPEFSPSLVTTIEGTWLYFSSTGYDANMDLYVSERQRDGTFGPPARIVELSTSADDRMPNVSRDGLTIVFVSNRTDLPGAVGGFDVYVSTRNSTADPWSAPVNLGPSVNTVEAESRPSLSADGRRLYFGRLGDIWVATRGK